MEFLSIVNENGVEIGSATKEEALEKGFIRRVVRVFVVKGNRLFLQKRSPNKKIAPSTYDQSAGGHVDYKENYLAAAERETKEEIGISGLEFREITSYYFEEELEGKIIKSYDTIFEAKYSGGFKLNSEELSGGKWFNIEELNEELDKNKELFAPGLIGSLPRYLENR